MRYTGQRRFNAHAISCNSTRGKLNAATAVASERIALTAHTAEACFSPLSRSVLPSLFDVLPLAPFSGTRSHRMRRSRSSHRFRSHSRSAQGGDGAHGRVLTAAGLELSAAGLELAAARLDEEPQSPGHMNRGSHSFRSHSSRSRRSRARSSLLPLGGGPHEEGACSGLWDPDGGR